MRRLFRRKWARALGIAVFVVALPIVALLWLSTGAGRRLQSEKDRLSALGFPMSTEERKAHFEGKGKNAAPLLEELAEETFAIKALPPGPGEDPTEFLREFEPIRKRFLEVLEYQAYYYESDLGFTDLFRAGYQIRARSTLTSALLFAREAAKKGDIDSALQTLRAADHFCMLVAGRGDTSSYIVGMGDLSLVTRAYATVAGRATTSEERKLILQAAESRPRGPGPKAAYLLEPAFPLALLQELDKSSFWENVASNRPHDEAGWLYVLPSTRKQVIEEQLAVWRRFAESFPEDETDFRAYGKAYSESYEALAKRGDRISRVAVDLLRDKDFASGVYARELAYRRSMLTAVRIVAGVEQARETDPFDDKPLKVRRNGRQLIVYSIGDNLMDDGGRTGDLWVATWVRP